MTTRDLLDADRWIDWDADGYLVFVRGPFAGERFGSVGGERIARLASLVTTPESTRDVLDRYVDTPRPQSNPHRKRIGGKK